MIRALTPREAETLIHAKAGDLDIIDVRDPHEWQAGHVPGARLLPLATIKADARHHLQRDGVLFVCARGQRSLSAARIAEELGLVDIYSLDGGTQAWASAGLPLESPVPSPAPPPAAEAAAPAVADKPEESQESLEPALDAIVGANLQALRSQRGLSLDALARLTGLGRSLLGQLELGRGAPSVGVVWRIARAFEVPFSALLAAPSGVATRVLRKKQAKQLVGPDGRFSSRALFPLGQQERVEFYELRLAAHSREDAEPHQPGTRENLVVAAGRLELMVGGERFALEEGDAIVFAADVAHSYANPGGEPCVMYLVMTYK